MIQTNAQFDAANAMLGKKPIYALTIEGQPTVYTTHDLIAEGITGVLPGYAAWLKTPRGSTQSIDVLHGTSSIGELECEVVDKGGAVRALVGSTTLEGKAATLSVGHPGMAWANFVALHAYQLYKITPSRGYTSWMFRARDRQMSAKRTVWEHPENGQRISEFNPWVLQGTPAEIVQAVYLFGLRRPESEMDRASLAGLDAAAEGLYKTVRPFLFVINEPVEAKQFLESEVYKVCGLYPVINNLGQLSLRAFRAPAAGATSLFTFSDANCVVLPEVDRFPITNEIIFKLDEVEGQAQSELIFIDATSVSTYGRAGQHVIESKGLRSNLGAQWFCEEVAARYFRRFAGTPLGLRGGAPVARIEAFLLTLPVWTGDFIYLTHPLMPNLLDGTLGVINRLYEVIDREPDYSRSRMKYRLLDTGLTGQEPARMWAPSARDFVVGVSPIY